MTSLIGNERLAMGDLKFFCVGEGDEGTLN